MASAAILLALLFFASYPSVTYSQEGNCGLLQDCQFDNFYDPEGACSGVWQCFSISPQRAGIQLADKEGRPKVPSVLLISQNFTYDSGIYQRVAVTPGKGYTASLLWAVERIDAIPFQEGYQINRRIGIDPLGGTDPTSPNIKWSSDYFGSGKFADGEIRVDEYARAGFITVFIRVINPYGDKVVEVYLDSPAVMENSGMAPIPVTAPTVTPPPPPPTAVPPTARPTVAAEPTPEPTPKPEPTDAPPTDEPTVEPSPTRTQEATRQSNSTRTRVAQDATRPARTRVALSSDDSAGPVDAPQISTMNLGIIGLVGLVGVSGAVLMVGLAAFLLLRRR